MVLATVSPTIREPIRPGPAVYATKFMSCKFLSAFFSKVLRMLIIFTLWSRAAISGITPPYSVNNST